jgi:hypothetical protein
MVMVPDSLVSYLQLMKLHTPVELIDLEQWDRISSIGLAIPSAATTFFGFECRLGQPDAKADLLLCADATEAGRRVLAANAYSIDLPQELMQHPVWQNVRHFSTNWESEVSVLYEQVRNIWLEFDVAESEMGEIPVPSAFFGPEPLFATPDATEEEHPYAWVWQQALPLLWGRSVSQPIVQNLIRCFAALPENAYVFQIGLMLAREWDGVRLCIRDISPAGILEFLSSVEWQGDINVLRDRLIELSDMLDRIDLDIDISDRVLPKIGLECYLRQQPKFESRWTTFLDSLLLQGLCLPQKYQSLMNYPGFIRKRMNPELWPTKLDKLSMLLGASHEWVIFKGLHHIKLVYQEASFKEAKAYLYVSRSLVKGE